MVFRYLRTLEGVSPPLALSHLVCQTTAKAFIATRAYPSLSSLKLINLMDSVRSHVLARRARQRHGYGAPRRARCGGRGHGQRDAPTPPFLVLLAQAGEPCSTAWAAESASSSSRHSVVKGPSLVCLLRFTRELADVLCVCVASSSPYIGHDDLP
jgi:hypothetical protein